jgi:AcrR family transcriptional regulator
MSRRAAEGAGDRILNVAAELFYDQGIQTVGLQQIIDACGCGKNLLYREFGSKDKLVAAYLERLEAEWQAKVAAALEPLDGDAEAQLLAVVDAAAAEVTPVGYRGCAFLNALAETADADSLGHRRAAEHVESLRSLFRQLGRKARLREPAVVADQLVMVVSGMQTSAPIIGGNRATTLARTVAADLVHAAR